MIDTRLKTFLTLCDMMNYRQTAEKLNMTQPAVTQHIHYLENLYGCKLFIYDRRSLKMTPEAEILKKYAENVLYQENKLKAELAEKDGVSLTVGATKTVGEYVIAEHVSRFLEEPKNSIYVKIENTENLIIALSEGKIDFALIEGFFDRSRYSSHLYREEPFVGLCGKGHPFANRTVSLDNIRNENLILREEGSGTRKILEQLLYEHNHSFADFKRITTVSSFGLITKLLEKNNCITFAYRAVKGDNNALAEFRVDGFSVSREFNYVYLDTPFSQYAVEYFDSCK
ncbi:MAG: LysR substrate-binding domain-containing protein [Candidatus Fimenecus sp.]